MNTIPALTIDHVTDGSFGFRLLPFEDDQHFNDLQRVNYFSIIWIFEGTAELKADFSTYEVSPGTMMFFTPFQPFKINSANLKGIMMNFHPDFFCIIKHQKEVACNGILFNNLNNPPYILINEEEAPDFHLLISQVKKEITSSGLAQYDLLVSYLKIFLINATRIKITQSTSTDEPVEQGTEPFILQQLREAIDQHFKKEHGAGFYADLMNISVKALGKIVKDHSDRTLTQLISEKIIGEAKMELYLTNKPVKEIAYELGFDDEYHFSRYFKNKADVSPHHFRNSLKNVWVPASA